MLAEPGRRAIVYQRLCRHQKGRRHRRAGVALPVVEVDAHAASDRLRIGKHLADRVDRARRDVGSLQRGQQRRPLETSDSRATTIGPQPIAVADARRIGREVGVVGQVRSPTTAQNRLELAVVADRQDDMAVLHRHHLIGGDVHMGVAHLEGRLARHEIIEVLVGQHGDLRIEQRHVDPLALARSRSAWRSAAWMAITA